MLLLSKFGTVHTGWKVHSFVSKNWPYKWDDLTADHSHTQKVQSVPTKFDLISGMTLHPYIDLISGMHCTWTGRGSLSAKSLPLCSHWRGLGTAPSDRRSRVALDTIPCAFATGACRGGPGPTAGPEHSSCMDLTSVRVAFLNSNMYNVWCPLGHVLLSFWSSVYQLGCTVAAVSAQRPVEHFKNALKNITTDQTPQCNLSLSLSNLGHPPAVLK